MSRASRTAAHSAQAHASQAHRLHTPPGVAGAGVDRPASRSRAPLLVLDKQAR